MDASLYGTFTPSPPVDDGLLPTPNTLARYGSLTPMPPVDDGLLPTPTTVAWRAPASPPVDHNDNDDALLDLSPAELLLLAQVLLSFDIDAPIMHVSF